MGSPIRKSADITDICSSPRLIAACHVLLRLLMPRHSPCALSSLTSSARTPYHSPLRLRNVSLTPSRLLFLAQTLRWFALGWRRELRAIRRCVIEMFGSLRIMQAVKRKILNRNCYPTPFGVIPQFFRRILRLPPQAVIKRR